jgi:hypothetical protein
VANLTVADSKHFTFKSTSVLNMEEVSPINQTIRLHKPEYHSQNWAETSIGTE